MFRFMTLTFIPPRRPQAPPVSARLVFPDRRSANNGGGRIAVGRNARWRAQVQLGRLVVEAEERAVATAGRPWLTREDDECAFVVAGEGFRALAWRAPGFARRRGGSVYCAAHDRQIYAPRPDPESGAPA